MKKPDSPDPDAASLRRSPDDSAEPRVDCLFGDALERPARNRAAFLDDACGDDEGLRREVESLLEAHEHADAVIGQPAAAERDPLVGRTIGRYIIERRLGAGGMGVVYAAKRAGADFEQRVAIKLIRSVTIAPEDVIARFRLERRVLARLEHPGIARLIDGGTSDDGQPYLVMELVEGEAIDRYCDDRRLPVRARIHLIRAVCAAVQHAHRNLVVHRDLKPANILVADGPPGVEQPQVKLLDFGIAKLLEDDLAADASSPRTVTAERRLTPDYASPEQIRGEPVSTATDVYALGVVLYELLTGRTPHDRGITGETREQSILTETPARLSVAITDDAAVTRGTDVVHLRRSLRGDIERVVLMALRKEPVRRYASADQLADDLAAYLAGRPVRARPDSLGYRASRFVRRNAVGVGVAMLLAAALVTAAVVSTTSSFRAEAARRRAESVSGFLTEMLGSIDPENARGRDVSVLTQVLDDAAARVDEDLGDEPESAAELHFAIGRVRAALGLAADAEPHLARAAALRREVDDEIGAAEADLALGVVFVGQSRYDEAEPLFRGALAVREARLGAEHHATAQVLTELGLLLEKTGGYAEAERTYRRALAIWSRVPATDETGRAETLSRLGLYLQYQNRLDEAEPCHVEALAIVRRVRGDGHLRLVVPLVRLADHYRTQRRLEEAAALFDEAIGICEEQLPAEHPRRLGTLADYANLLQHLERFEEAERLYRDVLAEQKRVHGRLHTDVGTTTNNLASLLRLVDRLDEASELFADAAEIYASMLGADHYWVSIALLNLANSEERLGRCETAWSAIQEAMRIRRLHESPEWQIAELEIPLGACLIAQGRTSDGVAVLERIEPVLLERFGPDSVPVRAVRSHLARLGQ